MTTIQRLSVSKFSRVIKPDEDRIIRTHRNSNDYNWVRFENETDGDCRAYYVIEHNEQGQPTNEKYFIFSSLNISPSERSLTIWITELIKPSGRELFYHERVVFKENTITATDNNYCISATGSPVPKEEALIDPTQGNTIGNNPEDLNNNIKEGYSTLYTFYKTNLGDSYIGDVGDDGIFEAIHDQMNFHIGGHYGL